MTDVDRRWRATSSHVRACVGGVGLMLAAVVGLRPDLFVLGAPLLLAALLGARSRPLGSPAYRARLGHPSLREGEATTWRVEITGTSGMEHAAMLLAASPWVVRAPAQGAVALQVAPRGVEDPGAGGNGLPAQDAAADQADQQVTLAVDVQSVRWGRRAVGPAMVAAHSPWAAYRWGPQVTAPLTVLTLPLPTAFDASAPTPHPRGLVGLNRSSRPGDGAEFASIRRFAAGDRLRRVHWPVSLRSGELHVASTWADQDSHVVLVVDALNDIGESGGLGGTASSMDTTVRAAGALAEYFLLRGDRVGMRVVGAANRANVAPAAGRRHLRRLLDILAAVEVASDMDPRRGRTPLGLAPGATVVMLSPLVSWRALEQAALLAGRGLTVIVVDTLPSRLPARGRSAQDDLLGDLAWRVRLLERGREIQRVQEMGVPVVPWRGPGSLDHVLRDLSRRVRAPRMVRR